MSDAAPLNGDAPTWGDLVESWVCDALDLTLQRDSYYDAVDDDGTRVEIKGAQVWIQNGTDRRGNPTRTRGRWKFWKDSHHDLVRDDGDYVLVVYADGDDGIEVRAHQRIKAATLTEYIGDCWYDVRSNPRTTTKGNPFRLSWKNLLEPTEVEP